MKLDPTKMKDWQIAEAAEESLRPAKDLAAELGLQDGEWQAYGDVLAKVDVTRVLKRVGEGRRGRYIDVTAITPTALGEGKTTTTLGLVQGLGKLGKKVIGCVRQPSGGPTFNIKGSAAGGGLAQVVPLTSLSLGLTGDIDAITNANNLAMVALNSRMQHERNHDDAWLAERGLKRLDVDPERIQFRWAMDFCAQGLRNIEIGRGGKLDGYTCESGFYITVASEVMAILAMSSDLADLRRRLSRIVVAYSKSGAPVTTADLEVDGAMCALLVNAIKPTLMQSIEGQPMFVHAGPFANIAIGQNSVVADRLACALGDYVVTESGFASDMGYEKFWNIKCRCSALKPDAVVLVATVRALKAHGGAPAVKAGLPLDPVYTTENLELLEKAATICSRTSTSSAAAACSRWCVSTLSTPTPPPSAISCGASPRRRARRSPCPTTGSRAAKVRLNSPKRSSRLARSLTISRISAISMSRSKTGSKSRSAKCTAATGSISNRRRWRSSPCTRPIRKRRRCRSASPRPSIRFRTTRSCSDVRRVGACR